MFLRLLRKVVEQVNKDCQVVTYGGTFLCSFFGQLLPLFSNFEVRNQFLTKSTVHLVGSMYSVYMFPDYFPKMRKLFN